MSSPETITELLRAWTDGDESAVDKLIPAVEPHLRRLAAWHMRGERDNHTLQTTALVNEAYLRLAKQEETLWQNRTHFFSIASRIMRRVLLDYAKGRRTQKRGAGAQQVTLDEATAVTCIDIDQIIEFDEVLERLEQFDRQKSRIVEMHHFGGLTVDEIAAVLGMAPATVRRHWRLAKAWLQKELREYV